MKEHLPFSNHIEVIPGRASPSYVLDGESLVVVDVGFPSDAKAILTHVSTNLGRCVSQIRLIVLTHSHFDHINGVDYLVERTGAAVAAHTNAQTYLTGKRSISRASLHEWKEFLLFLIKHNFPRPSISDAISIPWAGIPGIAKGIRSKVSHWLTDGQTLPNHPDWEVIHTPGHTDDSICLYNGRHKTLISGDLLINLDGCLRLNPLLRQDRQALLDSLEKVKRLDIDNLYPGWGPPVLREDVLDSVCVYDFPGKRHSARM